MRAFGISSTKNSTNHRPVSSNASDFYTFRDVDAYRIAPRRARRGAHVAFNAWDVDEKGFNGYKQNVDLRYVSNMSYVSKMNVGL